VCVAEAQPLADLNTVFGHELVKSYPTSPGHLYVTPAARLGISAGLITSIMMVPCGLWCCGAPDPLGVDQLRVPDSVISVKVHSRAFPMEGCYR